MSVLNAIAIIARSIMTFMLRNQGRLVPKAVRDVPDVETTIRRDMNDRRR